MKILLTLLCLCLISSCGSSVELKENPTSKFGGVFTLEELSFKNISDEILKPSCIQCHAGYSDYEAVLNEKDKILTAVLQDRMPKNASALDDYKKSLLKTWVDSGAPLGTGVDPRPSTKLEPTWNSLSKKVFFPKCVQCHNPNGQASFLDLSTRQKFFEQRDYLLNNFEDVENSYLMEVLTDPTEPMPPVWSNIERLNEEEIKTVLEWIEKGLPEGEIR